MKRLDPIVFVDRYRGERCEEQVYGERWLRWTYETVPGTFILETVIKRAVFSRFFGWRMSRPGSRARIRPFIRDYGLDESEFADPVEAFPDFNAFFSRKLKPEARPPAGGDEVAVFPADGRHLVFPDLQKVDRVYAKGQSFSLAELLGDDSLAEQYSGGSLTISRLCPVDYHRFHFPCAGVAEVAKEIPGHLYSVNPYALRRRLSCLWRNRRFVTRLDSERFGPALYLEIGATCVGSVAQTCPEGGVVLKGQEKGYFRFGGSCIMLLFRRGRIRFDDDLIRNSAEGLETYARMGDRLGAVAVD